MVYIKASKFVSPKYLEMNSTIRSESRYQAPVPNVSSSKEGGPEYPSTLNCTTENNKEADHKLLEESLTNTNEENKEEADQQLLQEAFIYATEKRYPAGSGQNRKRIIRKKATKFVVQNGELRYTIKKKDKVCFAPHFLGGK